MQFSHNCAARRTVNGSILRSDSDSNYLLALSNRDGEEEYADERTKLVHILDLSISCFSIWCKARAAAFCIPVSGSSSKPSRYGLNLVSAISPAATAVAIRISASS